MMVMMMGCLDRMISAIRQPIVPFFFSFGRKIIHTYIDSRIFPMEVGRNYRTPPATILIYSSRLVHIHTSDHTHTPVASTTHLTFLNWLSNKVNLCPSHDFKVIT